MRARDFLDYNRRLRLRPAAGRTHVTLFPADTCSRKTFSTYKGYDNGNDNGNESS